MTREQFAEWNEHWPLTYHESAVQHALRCGPAGPRRESARTGKLEPHVPGTSPVPGGPKYLNTYLRGTL